MVVPVVLVVLSAKFRTFVQDDGQEHGGFISKMEMIESSPHLTISPSTQSSAATTATRTGSCLVSKAFQLLEYQCNGGKVDLTNCQRAPFCLWLGQPQWSKEEFKNMIRRNSRDRKTLRFCSTESVKSLPRSPQQDRARRSTNTGSLPNTGDSCRRTTRSSSASAGRRHSESP